MKYVVFYIFFTLTFTISYAQNLSNIESKNLMPEAGKENLYYYRPFEYLKTPDTIYASIVYGKNDTYFIEFVPIRKINGVYCFSYKAPVAAETMILSITDKNKKSVDNNDGLGFIIFFYDKKGTIPGTAYTEATDLLSYFAQVTLGLSSEKLRNKMINLFEISYSIQPSLKKETSYRYYLTLLYKEKKDAVKPKLYNYAYEMAQAKYDESKWMNAIYIYRFLRLNQELLKIEEKALLTYPRGKVAQNKFLNDFANTSELTIPLALSKMEDYINQFQDTTEEMKNIFYCKIIEILLNQKRWDDLVLYETFISNKINLTNIYNSYALKLTGEKADDGSALNIAKVISERALNITKAEMVNMVWNRDDGFLQKRFNRYADTYANILYKLGNYDSAFHYKNEIYSTSDDVGVDFLEKYALYAEKAKGDSFAYDFIIEHLFSGVNSSNMVNQLKSISFKLGISDSAYNLMKKNYAARSKEKNIAEIRNKFGNVKGINFTLENIAGKMVSLSSFKNKIVVLYFWASWCTPCLASFPNMQNLINKYKADKNVEFLFIDTWEPKGGINNKRNMQQNVLKIIKKNDYTFNVLLDENNIVADLYKLNVVPTKYIINKEGNIVFMGESSDLAAEIEKAKTESTEEIK